MASTSSVVALSLLLALSLVQAQNFFDPDPLPTSSSNASSSPDKRPPCVLINHYCGRIVPGTGMKKECCGDLICYKNKCRRRTCC